MDPLNKTVFGIATPEVRYSLAAVTFLVIFISIVGNVLVLVASLRDAIKLDKISVILVKNIAIADLSYAFLVILQVNFLISVHLFIYIHIPIEKYHRMGLCSVLSSSKV